MITGKEKKTIALVMENIFTDFAHEFITNVLSGVSARDDIDLVVIAGKYDGGSDLSDNSHRYRRVYNSIYNLESCCDIDGVIICLGSMAYIDKEQIIARFFKGMENVPKVFAIADIENCVCVNYDNAGGIREAVEYLVNALGVKKICMLGGREDNPDSVKRKEIFADCLNDNGLSFDESLYEATDMSMNSIGEARALLKRNPDVKAVFCVNDATAVSLYNAMEEEGLVPGKDIYVFGFDNTKMAGRMNPTLASVGAADVTMGQKAAELLINMMDGYEVSSELIPTKLYGRESLDYEMYEYTTKEMQEVDADFIYRMFDDCFYRYRYEMPGSDEVDIRRLFFEFMGRILSCMRNRYMSQEDFEEIKELVDIFFVNGAMNYTDAKKFLKSVDRIQGSINVSCGPNIFANRLFTHMKDCAILSISRSLIKESDKNLRERNMFRYFMVESTNYDNKSDSFFNNLIQNFDKLGLGNSALYTFEKPVMFDPDKSDLFPETIYLRCINKNGNLAILPRERQCGSTRKMFNRNMLPGVFSRSVVFPVFYRESIYGFILCELTFENIDSGEYVADQLGRAIFLGGADNE